MWSFNLVKKINIILGVCFQIVFYIVILNIDLFDTVSSEWAHFLHNVSVVNAYKQQSVENLVLMRGEINVHCQCKVE